MAIGRILSALALTLALVVVLAPAAAHPPAEHVQAEPEGEDARHTSEILESHDDTSSSPYGHGEVEPHDDTGSAPHEHAALPPAQDHHETGMASPYAADHHADEVGEMVVDHHGPDAAPGGHAHWGDHGPQNDFERTIAKTGALHSVAVHFPIALILAAALAQVLGLITGRNGYADTVRFLVWTAAAGGLATGLLGWAHAGPVASTEDWIMSLHRWLGTSLTVGLFVLAAAVEWHRRDASTTTFWTMNVLVFGAALAVAINGFLGGSLAHGGLAHLMGG